MNRKKLRMSEGSEFAILDSFVFFSVMTSGEE